MMNRINNTLRKYDTCVLLLLTFPIWYHRICMSNLWLYYMCCT